MQGQGWTCTSHNQNICGACSGGAGTDYHRMERREASQRAMVEVQQCSGEVAMQWNSTTVAHVAHAPPHWRSRLGQAVTLIPSNTGSQEARNRRNSVPTSPEPAQRRHYRRSRVQRRHQRWLPLHELQNLVTRAAEPEGLGGFLSFYRIILVDARTSMLLYHPPSIATCIVLDSNRLGEYIRQLCGSFEILRLERAFDQILGKHRKSILQICWYNFNGWADLYDGIGRINLRLKWIVLRSWTRARCLLPNLAMAVLVLCLRFSCYPRM